MTCYLAFPSNALMSLSYNVNPVSDGWGLISIDYTVLFKLLILAKRRIFSPYESKKTFLNKTAKIKGPFVRTFVRKADRNLDWATR